MAQPERMAQFVKCNAEQVDVRADVPALRIVQVHVAGNRLGSKAELLPDPLIGNYSDFLTAIGYDPEVLRAQLVPYKRPARVAGGSVITPVKPPSVSDGFTPLFNGVDLTGWKTAPEGGTDWRVENGILVGQGGGVPFGDLYTQRDDFADFHLRCEMRVSDGGVNLVHVAYRSSFIPDLIGGQVQVVFAPTNSTIEYIKADKLRALAVTTATRLDRLPDVPALNEFVPGYEADAWLGVVAPKGTPAEVIEKLNREINAGLTDPKLKSRFADLGTEPIVMTPAEFGKFLASETEKWGKLIQAANIKPE